MEVRVRAKGCATMQGEAGEGEVGGAPVVHVFGSFVGRCREGLRDVHGQGVCGALLE